ncbi:uncharacterized protein LOC123319031 [Coccinella septempunctata]|uniref:uncharacterized protein LOC123319031 n=1 Tax=Coccinella septempunctata TaxID=41139 RepID=UPI001D091949|nr:uncharacterized protein LOC123319031 [Coccinella septempunctata]
MAHGLSSVLKRSPAAITCKSEGKSGAGSRRIFAPHFKLQVLDSYRNDADCKGNQRATARKYGIHRRQIQKWLQAENNLRNSVCKAKSECTNPVDSCNNNNNNHEVKRYGIEMALRLGRLQDASKSQLGDGVKLIPAPSQLEVKAASAAAPAPLDFTTHSRSSSSASPIVATDPPPYPDSPIDLSFKKIASGLPSPGAPVPYPPSPIATPMSLGVQSHPDVWDLSKKRKLDVTCLSPAESPKPVKLFKPYLDDFNKDSSSSSSSTSSCEECPPPCFSQPITPPTFPSDYYFYNHNNNVCDIKAECTYTIHELQPKSSLTCCYPYPSTYPVREYEQPYYCQSYDDSYTPCLAPLKQRQSYSLDFKLSAIDCYYEDSTCKGNQRAVANKYNIHRRQVQKWLKQEEELRQRNQIIKHTQLVR